MIINGRIIQKPKYCLNQKCGYELSRAEPNSTTSFRTDGYCSAKCKRRDRHRQMREIEQSIRDEQNETS